MCGLFGYLGKNKTNIDYEMLISLGIDNDIRGGDSCGLFIDGEVEYGINKQKFFEDFYHQSTLLKDKKQAQIILGHDRKASVGKKTVEQAQPVIIKNSKTDKIEFVLIHNGTISNYKELAKKYLSEPYDELTDSQVMARIFYHHGYEVLKEYIGAGVFITADYRQKKNNSPIIHLFKGFSKKTQYSKEAEEERPLYLLKDEQGYWFSSLSKILGIKAFVKNLQVTTLKPNILVMFDDGKLYNAGTYDRSELFQKQSTPTYTSPYYSGYYDYDDYDGYNYGSFPGSGFGKMTIITEQNESKKAKEKVPTTTITKKQESKNTNSKTIIATTERLIMSGLRYLFDGKMANGGFNLDKHGNIYTEHDLLELTERQLKDIQTYYFFNGRIVYGEAAYDALVKICEEFEVEQYNLLQTLGPDNPLVFQPFYDVDKKLYVNASGQPIDFWESYMPFQKEGNIIQYYITNGILYKTETPFLFYAKESLTQINFCQEYFNNLGITKILNILM